MRGENFSAGSRDFYSNLVLRANERAPRAGGIRPVRRGGKQPVHHRPHNGRITLVTLDRTRVVREVNNRWRRLRRGNLPDGRFHRETNETR
jgi:hypothetical protein